MRAVLADEAWSLEENIREGGKTVHFVLKSSDQMHAVEREGGVRSNAEPVFVNVYGDQESIPTT